MNVIVVFPGAFLMKIGILMLTPLLVPILRKLMRLTTCPIGPPRMLPMMVTPAPLLKVTANRVPARCRVRAALCTGKAMKVGLLLLVQTAVGTPPVMCR